ncbi:MAG: T9SS type A sorting domain-containing protein [Ignavibacteriaceae bacterium]|nr:T9SS type A sorting domain-containing protein [Ignavibacteriaceae bacterium]
MRMLKNALIAKGYEIDWVELPEGHSWGLWRATIDKMLIYFFPSTASEVEDEGTHLPESFYLRQNFPNPFNPTTNIKFRTTDLGFVSLKVYDILSNEITTLVNDVKPAGSYEVIFSASELTSGVYFYTLQAGQYIETRKMTLLR